MEHLRDYRFAHIFCVFCRAIFVSLTPRARDRERENETGICDIVLLGPNYCLARTFLRCDATAKLI